MASTLDIDLFRYLSLFWSCKQQVWWEHLRASRYATRKQSTMYLLSQFLLANMNSNKPEVLKSLGLNRWVFSQIRAVQICSAVQLKPPLRYCRYTVTGDDLMSRLPLEETQLASLNAPQLTIIEVKVSTSISKIDVPWITYVLRLFNIVSYV